MRKRRLGEEQVYRGSKGFVLLAKEMNKFERRIKIEMKPVAYSVVMLASMNETFGLIPILPQQKTWKRSLGNAYDSGNSENIWV